jgi:hypothetical protein
LLPNRVVRLRAGDAEREQHDGGVDHIAAVAAPVAADERGECRRPGLLRETPPGLRPARELEHDRGEHERAEAVRDQPGERRSGAEGEQACPYRECYARRPGEGAPERSHRRAPPGDERADPHQQQQRQPEHAQEEVVVRPADRDRLAAHRLGEQRIGDAPEHRQAERDEQ